MLPQAEVCDLCGTVVDTADIIRPDWIDSRPSRKPAFISRPDPVLDPQSLPYPIDPIGSEDAAPKGPARARAVAEEERLELAPSEDFFNEVDVDEAPPMGRSLTPEEVRESAAPADPDLVDDSDEVVVANGQKADETVVEETSIEEPPAEDALAADPVAERPATDEYESVAEVEPPARLDDDPPIEVVEEETTHHNETSAAVAPEETHVTSKESTIDDELPATWMADDEPAAVVDDTPASRSELRAAVPPVDRIETGAYCSTCGSPNVEGFRFCSTCGSKAASAASILPRDLPPEPVDEPEREAILPPSTAKPVGQPQAGAGRLLAVIVGASVMLVVALYMISVISGQRRLQSSPLDGSTVTETAPASEPEPLTGDARQRAQSLRSEIAELVGAERLGKQRELIGLYIAQRRLDLGAGVQQEVAEATNTESEWIRAGNLWYDWMESRTGADKGDYARRAIAAYQQALSINPDNLDVRTDMAIAYLYDPSNSMEAIRQTNEVLDRNPNHIQANFNRGIMLMQINRIDQAVDQFEKVKTLVGDANSPIYQRAEQALATARNLQTSGA